MTSRLLCEEYHSYTIIHSAYSSVQITRETQVMLHVIYNIVIVVPPVAKLLTRVEELLLFCSNFFVSGANHIYVIMMLLSFTFT